MLGQSSINSCILCSIQQDLKISESNNFCVLYDPYPLLPGHIMIVSKSHYGCAGEVPEDIFQELLIVKNVSEELVVKEYGCSSSYEHGRAGSCMPGEKEDNCQHFHLHILPLKGDINVNLPKIHFEKYIDVKDLFLSYGSYLFIENYKKDKFFYMAKDHNIPTHYVRSCISDYMNKSERSDWSKYQDDGLFEKSLSQLPRSIWKDYDIFR